MRQLNRASHLRIQTPDLDQSLLFYQSLGFQTVQGGGGTEKKYILLKCPGQKLHQPYILLEYTPDFQRVNRHAANLDMVALVFSWLTSTPKWNG